MLFNSIAHRSIKQAHTFTRILFSVLAGVMGFGCATNKIQTQSLVTEPLPRPNQILVYDFAATAAEVPADSTILREFSVEPSTQSAEESAVARDLGARIAAQLAAHLRKAGLPAMHVPIGGTAPATSVNDILIRGYLVSVKEGSAAKRIMIGFGSGASELQAAGEMFQVTPEGSRRLGTGTATFGGSKTPGSAIGAAGMAVTGNPIGLVVSGGMNVYGEARGSSKIQARAQKAAEEIAKVLEKRARELGWID